MVLKTRSCSLLTVVNKSSPRTAIVGMAEDVAGLLEFSPGSRLNTRIGSGGGLGVDNGKRIVVDAGRTCRMNRVLGL